MQSDLTDLFLPAFWETLAIVGVSGGIGALSGVPLGMLPYLTTMGGVLSAPVFSRVAGPVVNAVRLVPFIILLVAVIPFMRLLAGPSISTAAAIAPLTIVAIPSAAHPVETALCEVDRGLIEATQPMGATMGQLVYRVLLPEAIPGTLVGLTTTFASLVGYSAMAGTIGGGGLDNLGICCGCQRYESDIMLAIVVILTVFVQAVQSTGDWLVRHLSHR